MAIATLLTALPGRLLEIMNSLATELIVLLFISVGTGFMLYARERFDWWRRVFDNRLNVSLNTFVDGVLRLRGLDEDETKRISISPHALRLMNKSSKNTTLEDEFLRFGSKMDEWLVYREVVIGISKIFSAAIILADIRGITEEVEYLVAITDERDAAVIVRKKRAIVVQVLTLQRMFRSCASVQPEIENQGSRIHSLATMYAEYLRGTWPECKILKLPRI